MHKDGNEVHVNETEASGGNKTGHMRWILGVGLFLAIALLSLVWITGALSQGEAEGQITASAKADASSADDGDSTDSIVSEDVAETDKPATGAAEAGPALTDPTE